MTCQTLKQRLGKSNIQARLGRPVGALMRGGVAGGRGGIRGMTRGGFRGRARGGLMRGALSMRGMCPRLTSHLPMWFFFQLSWSWDRAPSLCSVLASHQVMMPPFVPGKRVLTGVPIRGRGSAGRLVMRRGGRHRGVAVSRGGTPSRGAGRGGMTRGQAEFHSITVRTEERLSNDKLLISQLGRQYIYCYWNTCRQSVRH